MARNVTGWIAGLFGWLNLFINSVAQSLNPRSDLNLIGTEINISAVDNTATEATDVTFAVASTLAGKTLTGATLTAPTLNGASSATSNDTKGTETNVHPVNVQTTDATVTSLDTYAFTTSDAGLVVSALVVGVKSDGSQVAGYSLAALFKNDSGTVTQVGTTTQTVLGESDSAWDATIDNSTTTIRIRVTGKAATTIRWTSVWTRLQVIP